MGRNEAWLYPLPHTRGQFAQNAEKGGTLMKAGIIGGENATRDENVARSAFSSNIHLFCRWLSVLTTPQTTHDRMAARASDQANLWPELNPIVHKMCCVTQRGGGELHLTSRLDSGGNATPRRRRHYSRRKLSWQRRNSCGPGLGLG